MLPATSRQFATAVSPSTAAQELPAHRLRQAGGRALSDAELLAILAGPSAPTPPDIERARENLAAIGCLPALFAATHSHLRFSGFTESATLRVLAALELARRLAYEELSHGQPLEHPEAVARYLTLSHAASHQEIMGAIFLDSRKRLLGDEVLFRGTPERVAADPRVILRKALVRGAVAFILFVVRPGADVEPSPDDMAFTRRLRAGAEHLGIVLLDHVILGQPACFVSLRERGAV